VVETILCEPVSLLIAAIIGGGGVKDHAEFAL
jgi:hypothetical protein